jgi:hypothetical protein
MRATVYSIIMLRTLILVGLAGCVAGEDLGSSTQAIGTPDIVGNWVTATPQPGAFAVLTFNADGTFSATAITDCLSLDCSTHNVVGWTGEYRIQSSGHISFRGDVHVGPSQLPSPWQESWMNAEHKAVVAPDGWLNINVLPTPGEGPSESPSLNYGTIDFPYRCQHYVCSAGKCICERGE